VKIGEEQKRNEGKKEENELHIRPMSLKMKCAKQSLLESSGHSDISIAQIKWSDGLVARKRRASDNLLESACRP
jgi:hypothetical protein